MATFDTIHTHRPTLLSRVFPLMSRLQAAARERAVYAKTVRELDRLSDRELSDIGLGRSDIHDVARKTALGA